MLTEKIEILSVQLLDDNRPQVEALKRLAADLRLEFGWHYLLDLAWILQNLPESLDGKRIMDAGAGTGILQWYLAQQGAEVFSVDRMPRADLPLRFRRRFNVHGLRPDDLNPGVLTTWNNLRAPINGSFLRRQAVRMVRLGRDFEGLLARKVEKGRVYIYNQDLANLPDLPDASLDAVVSVSALEHNSPEGLAAVIPEIMRLLKPGAPLLATLTAARDQDWFHAPSNGWCYTADTLIRLFNLPHGTTSNQHMYDQLMTELRDCAELRDNLASFYSRATDKGMPGGVWDPQYQPVGVIKIKG